VEAMVELDAHISRWTATRSKFDVQLQLQGVGVPAAAVQTPPERIDHDRGTSEFGLWPTVEHAAMGSVRVDGIPVHLSDTDWVIERGAPLLGEHNRMVFRDIVGLSEAEIEQLERDRVV
ncbi:MAG: CoA transferase, partial [Acidimicrobiia bacterium]